jgi:hypothetical protein
LPTPLATVNVRKDIAVIGNDSALVFLSDIDQTFSQTAPLVVISGGDQPFTEGAANSFSLGSFTDLSTGANSWTVDVNWGDNSAHTTFTTTSQGTLPNNSHTFGEEGPHTVTVTVTDSTNLSGSNTFQVAGSDPAVVAVGINFTAVAGQSFTGPVATFTDPGGAEPNVFDPTPNTISGHYIASINWGDGSAITTGTITLSGGVFTVSGSHTYAAVGTFTTSMAISHELLSPITITGTATVSPPAPPPGGGAAPPARQESILPDAARLLGADLLSGTNGVQPRAGQGFQGGIILTSPGVVVPVLLTQPFSSLPSGRPSRGDDMYWQFLYLHRGDPNTDANAWAAEELALIHPERASLNTIRAWFRPR